MAATARARVQADLAASGQRIANARLGIADKTAKLEDTIDDARKTLAKRHVAADEKIANATRRSNDRVTEATAGIADEQVHLREKVDKVQSDLAVQSQKTEAAPDLVSQAGRSTTG